jgi:hypothetical protein
MFLVPFMDAPTQLSLRWVRQQSTASVRVWLVLCMRLLRFVLLC